jgi:transcriptional regulator with XRE-family HTH domain
LPHPEAVPERSKIRLIQERLSAMRDTTAGPHGHFAAMLSSAMDELDLSIRELSKQLGISPEHARRLQAGEALPSRLLVEKTAVATGVPGEELQLAVQRDRMSKKLGAQMIAETSGISKRVSLFEPLINALDTEQLPAAYAMLERLVKTAKSKRPPAKQRVVRPVKEAPKHVLPRQKKAKKKAVVA